MSEIRNLIEKARDTLDANAYEDFIFNTIQTCGYNSDTYALFDKLNGSINTSRYKNHMEANLKECARESGLVSKEQVENIKFKDNPSELKESLNGIITSEEIDNVMFDTNVEMVDDYIRYNKLNGITVKENVNDYLDAFKTGVDKIESSPEYQDVKNDIYSDAGLSLEGLENLEMDVSIDDEQIDFAQDDLEEQKDLVM